MTPTDSFLNSSINGKISPSSATLIIYRCVQEEFRPTTMYWALNTCQILYWGYSQTFSDLILPVISSTVSLRAHLKFATFPNICQSSKTLCSALQHLLSDITSPAVSEHRWRSRTSRCSNVANWAGESSKPPPSSLLQERSRFLSSPKYLKAASTRKVKIPLWHITRW